MDEGRSMSMALRELLQKFSSWMMGFEALIGGDPAKNGGDASAWKLINSEL